MGKTFVIATTGQTFFLFFKTIKFLTYLIQNKSLEQKLKSPDAF